MTPEEVGNERLRPSAAYLNGMAVALITAGVFGPIISYTFSIIPNAKPISVVRLFGRLLPVQRNHTLYRESDTGRPSMTTVPEIIAAMMPLLAAVFTLGIAYFAHHSALANTEPVKQQARSRRP
jgi:hypothetical protein